MKIETRAVISSLQKRRATRAEDGAKRREHARLQAAVVSAAIDYRRTGATHATMLGVAFVRAVDALNEFERGHG